MREKPVSPSNRLSALQMRVTGHEVVDLGLGALDHHTQEISEKGDDGIDFVEEPHAHVCGDLVVPAATCVQFAGNRPDELLKTALVCRVDVFIIICNTE